MLFHLLVRPAQGVCRAGGDRGSHHASGLCGWLALLRARVTGAEAAGRRVTRRFCCQLPGVEAFLCSKHQDVFCRLLAAAGGNAPICLLPATPRGMRVAGCTNSTPAL